MTILQWRAQMGKIPPDPTHGETCQCAQTAARLSLMMLADSPNGCGYELYTARSAGGARGLTSLSRELPGNREGGRERLWPPLTVTSWPLSHNGHGGIVLMNWVRGSRQFSHPPP